jgi:tRNA A37 methylthiotransferase MiaB
VRSLNDGTTKTIVLTGTETACYGEDIGTSFAILLDRILGIINPHVDLHIAQFNPEGLRLETDPKYAWYMLSLFADPRVKDIQLPIQTTSPRLLALMNRRYSPDALGRFLTNLIDTGGTSLRTDLLVGFPTETMEEFAESVTYARRYFDEVAIYRFEMKKGTPVYGMGLTPVAGADVVWRRKSAMDLLRQSGLLVHSGGQDVETLLENDRAKALRRQSDGE